MRKLNINDASFMYELNNNPKVIQYTGDPPFESIDSAKAFILNYDQYKLYNVGRWVVELKEDSTAIGWCGLKYHPKEDEYDIGFRLFEHYWGKGYATEAAEACLSFAKKIGITRVVAHAMKDNLASIQVLKKIGMKIYSQGEMNGNTAVYFEYHII